MLLAAGCMIAASAAAAQALRDPTRPPMASLKGVVDKAERPGWLLQSVLISPERRYAIINGEIVQLGGSIAGAELVAIAEERVTLKTQEGMRIVNLFPDVARIAADAGRGTAKSGQAPETDSNIKAQKSGHAGIKQ